MGFGKNKFWMITIVLGLIYYSENNPESNFTKLKLHLFLSVFSIET